MANDYLARFKGSSCSLTNLATMPSTWVSFSVVILLGTILSSSETVRAFAAHQVVNAETPLYVHVHIAKTAGTELNRLLARRYLGVCGNKASSIQQNIIQVTDIPSHKWRYQVIEEFGLHNCALLSLEKSMSKLQGIFNQSGISAVNKIGLVPCRPPIDHFLSMCNHQGINVSALFEGSMVLQRRDV